MSKKKVLTEEELIALASQSIETPENSKYIPEEANDILKFIRDYNIRSGPNKVPNGLIYNTYLKWGGKRSIRGFFRMFRKYFQPYRGTYIRYYLLISTSFPDIDDVIKKEIVNYNQLKKLQEQQDIKMKEFAKKGMLDQIWKEIDTSRPRLPYNLKKRKKDSGSEEKD